MAKSEKRKIGDIGESVACTHLKKQGFKILERNYWKKYGEIDIIARKGSTLHFVEVKSVTRATMRMGQGNVARVTGESGSRTMRSVTHETDEYRPEENMHPWKMQRLVRTIEIYLSEKDVSHETEWQLDLMVVYLNMRTRRARVEVIESVL